MSELWFLRVEGREYGPADLTTLRDWMEDGRVLRENEARLENSEAWVRAAEIPDLFAPDLPNAQETTTNRSSIPGPGFFRICFDSVALYIKGFFPYLGLTLLVLVPKVLWQMTAAMLENSSGVDVSVRTQLGAAFGFCMLLVMMVMWPVYITGIQILTADLARQGRMSFFEVLNASLARWRRVASLCLIVYLSLGFWFYVPWFVALAIFMSDQSVIAGFLILAVGVIQIWVFGRLFINFLFWQQCAVLEENDIAGTLRRSKDFARRPRPTPWYKRPLWLGVFVASVCFLFVVLLWLPTAIPQLPQYREFLKVAASTQDPQKLIEAMSSISHAQGAERLDFALGLLKWMLRPLLGIPFVLIFLATRTADGDPETEV